MSSISLHTQGKEFWASLGGKERQKGRKTARKGSKEASPRATEKIKGKKTFLVMNTESGRLLQPQGNGSGNIPWKQAGADQR